MHILILEIAAAIWLTSSLFMLTFWFIALVSTYKKTGQIFLMSVPEFLYIHFCPIVHTYKCFWIMRRAAELKKHRA